MEKAKHVADMKFYFKDYTEDNFNESMDCTFAIWDTSNSGMSMELYYSFCRRFAAAMGFDERTISEWFGDY